MGGGGAGEHIALKQDAWELYARRKNTHAFLRVSARIQPAGERSVFARFGPRPHFGSGALLTFEYRLGRGHRGQNYGGRIGAPVGMGKVPPQGARRRPSDAIAIVS